MEEGIKIVVSIMVALIIAFGVIFIVFDRTSSLNDEAMQKEDQSASGFRNLKCKMTGNEYYTMALTCNSVCDNGGGGVVSGPCVVYPDCCCTTVGFKLIDATTTGNCNLDCSPNSVSNDRTKCGLPPTNNDTCCCICG